MAKDFEYAVALMQGSEDSFSVVGDSVPIRDSLFSMMLSSFDGAVKVFQIGAIESLDGKFRVGSGWSDTIFGKHIIENGGSLTIVDINLDHLAHSALMASNIGYPLQIKFGDAIDHIEEGYDIYYLDGADEPLGHQQTLEQFQKIEHTQSLVIVDDINTKGFFLTEYLEQNDIEYEVHNVGNNGMMTVDMRGQLG